MAHDSIAVAPPCGESSGCRAERFETLRMPLSVAKDQQFKGVEAEGRSPTTRADHRISRTED
jgi:hypothetical protein